MSRSSRTVVSACLVAASLAVGMASASAEDSPPQAGSRSMPTPRGTSSACRRASCSASPIWSRAGTPTPARPAPAAATARCTSPTPWPAARPGRRTTTAAPRTRAATTAAPGCTAARRGEARRRPPPALQTARRRPPTLTGADADDAAHRPGANIRGGAALLAAYQRDARRADGAAQRPGRLVRRGGPLLPAPDHRRRDGLRRRGLRHHPRTAPRAPPTTASAVRLAAAVGGARSAAQARPARPAAGRPGRRPGVPARPRLRVDPGAVRAVRRRPDDYGNHDLADRPKRQKIEYIVIHDTEGTYATTLNLVQDPTYVSWHYTLRSVDGHIAQHVKTKDVALARRQLVRQRQVDRPRARGLRGRRAPGTPRRCTAPRPSWSATWPQRYGIPLDRAAHPRPRQRARHDRGDGRAACTGTRARTGTGRTTSTCSARRFWSTGTPRPGWCTIDPDYATNQPAFTGCDDGRRAVRAARLVRGRPAHRAARRRAAAERPRPAPGRHARTRCTSPTTAPRASAGQTFALAGPAGRLDGDLVPRARRAGSTTRARRRPRSGRLGLVATPKPGKATHPGVRPGLPGGGGLPGRRAGAGDLAAAVHAVGRAAVRGRRGAAGPSTTGRPRSPAPHRATGR